MVSVRVIPCLLYDGSGLVKTVRFKSPAYIGDATNAIRIFNEKEVDELILLDISATRTGQRPNIELIKNIASECFMPVCYGGGVRTIGDVKEIISAGIEKISFNTIAVESPAFIREVANIYGSSTTVVSIDYRKNIWGKQIVTSRNGSAKSSYNPLDFAMLMEEMGAGELLINSIDRDGTMEGYDIELLSRISEKVSIPVIAMGGAGNVQDLSDAVNKAHVSAVAAGSMFVFQGKHKAVLINYPEKAILKKIFTI